MSLASPEALAAARALHAAAQALYATRPGAHAPGLQDRGGMPDAIGRPWDALLAQADIDHALLCPAFSFILHQSGAYLEEGAGEDLPTALLPRQDDPDLTALCARGLDLLPPSGMAYLDPAHGSAHQRALVFALAPPTSAVFDHLLRRGRVCVLLSFLSDQGRFRLSAAARR